MPTSSVTAHASVMGSSTAERVINCPGSVSRVARSPKMPAGQAALKGTAQHAVIEHILLNGGKAADYLGTQTAGVLIDDELADNIEIAHRSSELLLSEYTGYQFVEQRVTHTPDTVFGTGDVVAISECGRKALFADQKFGYVEVEPSNYQNRFIAAVGLRDETVIGSDADGEFSLALLLQDVEEFTLAIIQPSFDPAHTTVTVDRADIETFHATIELALTQSASADAPLQIGKWCGYCPAKLACEAWRDRNADLIDLMKHGPEWAHANIAAILDAGADFLPLYEAAKERARHEMDNGRTVPGWILGTGRSRQEWADANPLDTVAVLRGLGLTDAQIIRPLTPAKAKSAIGKDEAKLAALAEHINVSRDAAPLIRDKEGTDKAPATPAAAFARAAQAAKHGPSKGPGKAAPTRAADAPVSTAATTTAAVPRRRPAVTKP